MRKFLRNGIWYANDLCSRILSEFQIADLSIFHKLVPPPTGGGHQFIRAFWAEAEKRGFKVENNTISRQTRACLFNSFNFDSTRMQRLYRNSVTYVHRVDGPVGIIRGTDNEMDRHIWALNQSFANKTIFQSEYSLRKHRDLGLEFKNPNVIINAPDPAIFNKEDRIPFSTNRKIRLIASSWSDNPKKGAAIYDWLDKNLDWEQFDFTFVGKTRIEFKNIKIISPLPSQELACEMKQHDIYITASQDDPCSNSLIEALSCGLPALFLNSGGHPEIVKQGGLGFENSEEIPHLLQKLINAYEKYEAAISVPTISQVANSYLELLELA